MPVIGVCELGEQANEVIRRVHEEGTEYVVICQGRPVAIIRPPDTMQAEMMAGEQVVAGGWERYQQLAEEIRRSWPSDLSTQELIDSIRR